MSMAIKHILRSNVLTLRLLIGATSVSIIAILSIVSFLLVREHRTAELAAIRTSLNIVQLVGRDVQNTVNLYDSALNALIDVSKRSDLNSVSLPLKHMLLFDKAEQTPANGGFYLLNAQGDLVADSRTEVSPKENFSHWPSFVEHRDSNSPNLFISHPFDSAENDGICCISFSRRISGPDGRFLGVAVAQMKLDYFKTLFQRLDLEPHGFIRLISTDGTPLTQHPEPASADAHTNLSNNPVFVRFLHEHRGSFIALSSIDGEERLYNFSEVGDLPLIVVVSLATDDVFSAWRRNAILVGIGTLMLCSALLVLTWLLGRELHLRQRAERQLEALATTDPLTGLANRRKLDQTLEQEWRRAQRSGKPLSLIMFDIDHFKNFNDTYGHQDGDEALKRVARTIQQFMHRSTDLAARYGGEEFAVVLSDTDASGAYNLAQSIRQAVEQLEPLTPSHRRLTTSMGVSTCQVKPGDQLAGLINSADQALYQAKKAGRNCVISAAELS